MLQYTYNTACTIFNYGTVKIHCPSLSQFITERITNVVSNLNNRTVIAGTPIRILQFSHIIINMQTLTH